MGQRQVAQIQLYGFLGYTAELRVGLDEWQLSNKEFPTPRAAAKDAAQRLRRLAADFDKLAQNGKVRTP